MPKPAVIKREVRPLSEDELDQISVVFHQYETGVRSGTIKPGVGETPSQLLIFNPPPFQDLTCNHINR